MKSESEQIKEDLRDKRLAEAMRLFRARDFAGAMTRLQTLAKWGHETAPLYIANMYERGYPGVPRDLPKAIEMYESLAKRHNASATATLAKLYFNGTKVPRDYPRALQLYGALAASGEARSQFMLGDMYRRGLGVERDEALALKYFESAAVGGNVNALRSAAALRLLKRFAWADLLLLAKAFGVTWYFRLFDKHNDRVRRV